MEGRTMTLEELVKYANDAKNEHEKREIEKNIPKSNAIRKIIEKAIDALKDNDGAGVAIKKVGEATFLIDRVEYYFSENDIPTTGIELEDIKEVIDQIPALKASYIARQNEPLMVWFSKTVANSSEQ